MYAARISADVADGLISRICTTKRVSAMHAEREAAIPRNMSHSASTVEGRSLGLSTSGVRLSPARLGQSLHHQSLPTQLVALPLLKQCLA